MTIGLFSYCSVVLPGAAIVLRVNLLGLELPSIKLNKSMLVQVAHRYSNTRKKIFNTPDTIIESTPGILIIPNIHQDTSVKNCYFYARTIPDHLIPNNTNPVYFGTYILIAEDPENNQVSKALVYMTAGTTISQIYLDLPVIVEISATTITAETEPRLSGYSPQQSLSSYFGDSLQNIINQNSQAIGSELGISATEAQDPDKLLAAIVRRSRLWQIADGSDENGTTIAAPEKVQGIARREGQIGSRYPLTFWQPDTRPAALPIAQIY